MENRFGSWSALPQAFRNFAKGKREWADVVALLPVPKAKEKPAANENSPSSMARNKVRHVQFQHRPIYGNPIDFRGLRHEPVNEQGVVLMFGMVAKELGYMVEAVQTGFPDCEAKRQIGPGRWQCVRIEFEFESRKFRDHGHPTRGCDVIVCWRHNWDACPEHIEVVELSSVIKSLPNSKDSLAPPECGILQPRRLAYRRKCGVRQLAPALQETPASGRRKLKLSPSPATDLRNWPHSPAHCLRQAGTYIVTAGTYNHVPVFRGAEHLTRLTNCVLELAERYEWSLQAWAVFPNHYHLVGDSQTPESLRSFLRHLHSITAIEMNKLDETPGRRVWFEFWETRITFSRSYLSRLNYVHQNAVRHGLVRVPSQYPWCSAGWFERKATRSFYRTVSAFKTDKLNIPDDFEVPSIE